MAHLVIDGYNLMMREGSSFLVGKNTLEEERRRLALRLAAYALGGGHRITLVFDGGHSENAWGGEERIAGVQCIYSASGQTADEVMMEMAARLRDQLVMVSSDQAILKAAKKAGCPVLTSDEFIKKMNIGATRRVAPADPDDEVSDERYAHKRWITKKKGPSKRLPKAKRRALARLGGL